jgi:hypothetical protein
VFPFVLTSVFPVHYVIAYVVVQVTALAQMAQVVKSIVVFVAIKVRSCKHNGAASIRVRFTILSTTIRVLR